MFRLHYRDGVMCDTDDDDDIYILQHKKICAITDKKRSLS